MAEITLYGAHGSVFKGNVVPALLLGTPSLGAEPPGKKVAAPEAAMP